VEAVSRHDMCNRRVLDWLERKDVPLDDADFEDFIPVLLDIVAKNRVLEAREFVLNGISKADKSYLSEGYHEAFVSIAEEGDWEPLYSRWKESPKQYRWFLDLLIAKPSKKRLEIALDMLRIVGRDTSDSPLITFLLENYVKESHPVIAALLDGDTPSVYYWGGHTVELVVSGMINPDSLADFDRWLQTAEEIEWNLEEQRFQYTEERLREKDFADFEDDDEDFDDDDAPYLPTPSKIRELMGRFSGMSDDEDDFDDKFGPAKPLQNVEPRTGRNDPCPCGSGKKYKKCCLK